MPTATSDSGPDTATPGGVAARLPTPTPTSELARHKRLWAWWLTKAVRIAFKQNAVLSWLAYYLGMSTVGFWMRKQDRLDRAPRSVGDSAWHTREAPIQTDRRRARKPF